MTSHEKKTPEQATLGAGAPGDPTRMEAPAAGPRFLDVPVAYEKTDVAVRPVARVAGLLALVTAASVGVTFGVFLLLGRLERKADPPPAPLARMEGRQFPEPRLQTAPTRDYREVSEEERRFLRESGWVDQSRGVARIPIEEAMALYAESAATGRPLPLAPVAPLAASPAPAAAPSPGPAR